MLNVAIIGVGAMGSNHARIYYELEETNLVAVADINEKQGKAVAKKFNCNYYKDYKKMLNNEKIDAISIVVPTKLHEKVALDCIKAKKHILVEKPIASTIQEAENMIKAARKYKVKLAIGHIERFNPAVQELKRSINAKMFGKIIFINAKRVGLFPLRIKDADVVIDSAIHDIDVINFLLDAVPTHIFARMGTAVKGHGNEDYAHIFLIYKNADAFIEANWNTPIKKRELYVTGTAGYGELSYINQTLKLYKSNENLYEKYKTWGSFEEFKQKTQMAHEINVGIENQEPLKVELKHFVNCIIRNKKLLVNGEEGLEALKVAIAAIKAYKSALK